jgi:hypothetical protein
MRKMKHIIGLVGAVAVACAPAPSPVEQRVLASGQRIDVLRSDITGPADSRALFLAYTSGAKAGDPLLGEIRALWDGVRSDAERSGAGYAFIQANARYRFLEIYMVGWDLPEASLVPHEKGCVGFERMASGQWEEGALGCCSRGWCDLRGGYPPAPAAVHTIGPSQPEVLAVLLSLAAVAWGAAAGLSRLVRRIHDRYRRWLYGGTLVLLAAVILAVLPAFPVVWLYRLTRPGALLCIFSLAVWSSFLIPPTLFAMRLGVLLLKRPRQTARPSA